MNNNGDYKKWILFLGFFIFISAVSLNTTELVSAAPDTVYVNGTSGNDDYDGTSPEYMGGTVGPKKTINNAIDQVADDGTVNVAEGTYTESLEITKNLNLIKYGSQETIINPSSPEENMINISSTVNSAVINGFI